MDGEEVLYEHVKYRSINEDIDTESTDYGDSDCENE